VEGAGQDEGKYRNTSSAIAFYLMRIGSSKGKLSCKVIPPYNGVKFWHNAMFAEVQMFVASFLLYRIEAESYAFNHFLKCEVLA